MQRKHLWRTLLLPMLTVLIPGLIFGQAESIDTTSEHYQRRYDIGKTIGEWLPFLVIFTLALMVIIRTYRLSQKKNK